MLHDRFGKIPDMEGILFLVGINEMGMLPGRRKFSKEQKQDLMHVAVCTLLGQLGYYEPLGKDTDGWPHFRTIHPLPEMNMQEQEMLLKTCIINYFEK